MKYTLDMTMPEEFLDMNDSEKGMAAAGPSSDDMLAAGGLGLGTGVGILGGGLMLHRANTYDKDYAMGRNLSRYDRDFKLEHNERNISEEEANAMFNHRITRAKVITGIGAALTLASATSLIIGICMDD